MLSPASLQALEPRTRASHDLAGERNRASDSAREEVASPYWRLLNRCMQPDLAVEGCRPCDRVETWHRAGEMVSM